MGVPINIFCLFPSNLILFCPILNNFIFTSFYLIVSHFFPASKRKIDVFYAVREFHWKNFNWKEFEINDLICNN